jgi:glucokinase
MILTLDIGSTQTKIALVDHDYELSNSKTIQTDYATLNQLVVDLVELHEPEEIGIATGLAYSTDHMLYWVESNKRVNLYDASNAYLYNDAEAAALGLNLTLSKKIIQAADGTDNSRQIDQALVYLGTGFQFVPSVFTNGRLLPKYTLGCLMHAAGNVVHGNKRMLLAKHLNVAEYELRMSHLLSSRGLSAIHRMISGRNETPYEIIENGYPDTFLEYSIILGRALLAMVTGCSVWGGLSIGGTFASAISGKIKTEAVLESFTDIGDIFRSAIESIPISIIEDRYATNKAIAYGIDNNIETAVYAKP